MALTTQQERLGLDGLHAYTWGVIGAIALTLLYAVLQVAFVRPFLWPAGTGAAIAGDPSAAMPLIARPPDVEAGRGRPATVERVSKQSPAERAGIRPGDVLLVEERPGVGRVDFSALPQATSSERLQIWRDRYELGVRGDVEWTVRSTASGSRTVTLQRAGWLGTAAGEEWARRHFGMLLQIVVFTGGALILLILRSNDVTAALCVLALAFSAVAGGGPLLGAENVMPAGIREILTIFAWMASPLAFPTIALAILYFPSRSPLLARYPLLHIVPFLAAAPMLALSLATSLYLAGIDGLRGIAVWDASHPAVYYASFAAALSINVVAIVEGVHRYKFDRNANERRRVRVAVYTAVPGVFAYALKDGVPVVAGLLHAAAPVYPPWFSVLLQGLVLMPAFGLVYSVGVERVLGPRLVLRRSLQYALASRTLTILGVLPAVALAVSLTRHRAQTISELATGSSGFYLVLIGASIAAFKYRDRGRRWLDERFFREEYDARKILLSLASRVRFETNPADLASLVVTQIDEALHPETVAVLVSGVDEGRLTPVNVLRGSVESLPLDGGLVAMLRWSDEPLEIFLQDPRSPARRLPPEEQEWLECTNVALLVPVVGQDRALMGAIVLAGKRSDEPYTSEDRQLLASIASQMGLGFDVARLRHRTDTPDESSSAATRTMAAVAMLTECPRCGRCEESGTALCPADGSPMQPVPLVPRVVDNKYQD